MKSSCLLALAILFSAVTTMTANPATAQEYKQGSLKIENTRARVILQNRPAAGFMDVHNMGDEADRIISATSPMADKVELHTHKMENGVAKMRRVETIDVPAKSHVALKSGGLHLMIFGLKHKMKPGDKLPMKIVFEKAGSVDVEFAVESISGREMDKKMDHSDHSGHDSKKKMDHSDHSNHGSATQ